MLFAILTIAAIVYIAYRIAPVEHKEDAHVHGAGQIGLLAAVALFGMDYFTSFFYGTGEMMSALHPYGLQKWGYIAAAFIASGKPGFWRVVYVFTGCIQRRWWFVYCFDALSMAHS